MDVNGWESSTIKLVDLEAAGGAEVGAGAGAEVSSVEDPPPRVLPTPWKADRGLIGSYMNKTREDKCTGLRVLLIQLGQP
jgi:hypothetical protein